MRNIKINNKSKSGFTLVELVVVIAILGVLAAIAIPSVVGIINNAGKNKERDNAKALDEGCVNYYEMVLSGLINEEDHGKSTQENLPPKMATYSTQKAAAKSATVKNVCEFFELGEIQRQLENGVDIYVYDINGNVYTSEEADEKSISYTTVALNTTLEEMFNQHGTSS